MFPSQGLLKGILCPEYPRCEREYCLFSHKLTSLKRKIEPAVESTAKNKTIKTESSTTPTTSSTTTERLIKKTTNNASMSTSKSNILVNQNYSVLFSSSTMSKVPIKVRQKVLQLLTNEYKRLGKEEQESLKLSQEIELKLYDESSPSTYKNNAFNKISTLKRQSALEVESATGENSLKEKKFDDSMLHSMEVLVENGYPFEVEIVELSERTITQICDRCKISFVVLEEGGECWYHPGKRLYSNTTGEKIKLYECCGGGLDAKGCLKSVHVFSETFTQLIKHVKFRNVSKDPLYNQSKSNNLILAIDCEMGYTTHGLELLRVSVVDDNLKVLMDDYVLTFGKILDYNEKWSGINETLYEKKQKLSLADTQDKLISLMNIKTVLVGHSLESDLKALRIIYNRVLDTSILFPHDRGVPYKKSLKNLTREYLHKFIQESIGHDSIEDASSAMQLVLHYLKKYNNNDNNEQ